MAGIPREAARKKNSLNDSLMSDGVTDDPRIIQRFSMI